MKKFLVVFLMLGGLSQLSYALFCPNNFNSISVGDSMQSVIQSCGAATSQTTQIKPIYYAQQWIYFINGSTEHGSSKLSVVIDHGQVVNLTVTGNVTTCQPVLGGNGKQCIPINTQETQSVPSTSACGKLISLGDSMSTVQSACGQPISINHGQEPDAQESTTELYYNGTPPTTLIFQRGVLVDRVQH
jgi:hypothetical protein